jgi:phosphoribosylformimino-5-aminoimidazole carboxamide ribotide isomerase
MPFQVIPVIDLMNGQAVHAVGGRRDHYRPIQSILHPSCEPIPLARSLRQALDSDTLYIADLDAIAGSTPSLEIFREIIASGFQLWIDAGVRDLDSTAPLLTLDQSSRKMVVGLETVHGPRALADIIKRVGRNDVIFSLDLFEGQPRIAAPARWATEEPLELARAAIDCGVHHLLILDLARVGTGRGPGSSRLLAQLRTDHPSVAVSLGGGITRIEEINELRDSGASAVLVGSAIHDGRIGAQELARLETGGGWGSIR